MHTHHILFSSFRRLLFPNRILKIALLFSILYMHIQHKAFPFQYQLYNGVRAWYAMNVHPKHLTLNLIFL